MGYFDKKFQYLKEAYQFARRLQTVSGNDTDTVQWRNYMADVNPMSEAASTQADLSTPDTTQLPSARDDKKSA